MEKCLKGFYPGIAFGHCWGGFWEPAAGVDPQDRHQCYNCACFYYEPDAPEGSKRISDLNCHTHCNGDDGLFCSKYEYCPFNLPF